MQPALDFTAPRFDGSDFDPHLDQARLGAQLQRIKSLMVDGVWRTLPEIKLATGDPEASISAQLRHLRKSRFGSWTVERRRRGEPSRGCWEYRLLP